MRMWMIPAGMLCRKHLLGEHGELHKHLHNFVKRHNMTGRIVNNCLEPASYKQRHDQLASEMLRRGMNHQSPLAQPDISYLPAAQQQFKVDLIYNAALLMLRCPDCRKLIDMNVIHTLNMEKFL